jgi:cytochrome bd-type quinol oxidase subunit 2
MKKLFAHAVIALTLFAGFSLFATPVDAQGITENKNSACAALPGGCGDEAAATTEFNTFWNNVLNTVAFVVGAISVLMIVIGGLRYVISQGDAQATQNAKNTILYAVVGLVIAFIARGLVVFVINRI